MVLINIGKPLTEKKLILFKLQFELNEIGKTFTQSSFTHSVIQEAESPGLEEACPGLAPGEILLANRNSGCYLEPF